MSAVEALQTALAAEHAAVHVYGALGGRTSASAAPDLFEAVLAAYQAHRGRRDELTRRLRDLGAEPVAAEPVYDVPLGLGTERAVAEVALDLERGTAATYAFVVSRTSADLRRWAIRALTESAVRELVFRGTPEMFPGNEYADR